MNLREFWGRLVFRYAGRNPSSKSSAHSRRFYDIIGRVYDWLYADGIAGYRQAVAFVVDRCIEENSRILDIGCGTGLLLEKARRKAGFCVGLDLSQGMLSRAKSKISGEPPVHFVLGDSRFLPFRGEFDTIVSSFMLIILKSEERRKIILDLYDLLCQNGEAVFLTVTEEVSPQVFTKDEWETHCRDAGFVDLSTEDPFAFYRIVRARKGTRA